MDKLVEAIKEGAIVRVLESEARREGLFILRAVEQKKDENIGPSTLGKQVPRGMREKSYLEKWRHSFVDYKKNNVIQDLKPGFHWEIIRARRAKNLSRRQVALALGVEEEALRIIELGDLPSDDFVLISKLENYFGINLKKDSRPAPVSGKDLANSTGMEFF